MKPIDYILIGGVVLILGGIIAHLVYRKKQGKGGCCDCKNCPSAGACQRNTEEKNV